MKTPNRPTEDYNLDNHIGQEVRVIVSYVNDALNWDGVLLENSARGVFVKSHKSKEIEWLPYAGFQKLVLKKYKLPEIGVTKVES